MNNIFLEYAKKITNNCETKGTAVLDCKVPLIEVVSKPDNCSIKSYLENKGISAVFAYETRFFEIFRELSYEIANRFRNVYGVLNSMRRSIPNHEEFVCDISKHNEKGKEDVKWLLQNFGMIGALVHYTFLDDSVKGIITSAPAVINFVQGKFFEIYAYYETKKIVEKMAAIHNCNYEIAHNVTIEIPDSEKPVKGELDVVFRLGDKLFWIEAKSNRQISYYGKYYEIGKMIGVIPDRHILLMGDTSEVNTPAIESLLRYYIASPSNYAGKLEYMINMAFSNKKR